jgi:hypothetical protein
MKKNKAKLREKIRNRPKSRSTTKKKKKAGVQETSTEDYLRPHSHAEDQGMEAMSQVIMDFAAPLLETCSDTSSERKAISLSIYVWNTAMLPEAQCRSTLDDYLAECQKVMSPEELNTLSDYIDQLVQTRRTRFADNRKKITNCTFGDHGADRHIEVGYTIE